MLYEKYERGNYRLIRKHVKYLREKWIKGRCKENIFGSPYYFEYIDYKRNLESINFFKRHLQVRLEEYDALAEGTPDFNTKYVYYALQQNPEAYILPLAEVFAEQYNSVQLLARAAEKHGVKVYVKEHFVQPLRSALFYEDLASIPNVVLVKSTVSASKLMYHSIAVASQTGSALLEGLLLKKPAFAIGRGYVCKGAPGLYELVDEQQGADIIKNILAGMEIDLLEVKKYFYAMQMNTILGIGFDEAEKYTSSGEKELPAINSLAQDQRVKLIEEYIQKYC